MPTSIRRRSPNDAKVVLSRMQTDYIDLYQIHWPNHDVPVADTMAELLKLQESGKVRALGVCNFAVGDLTDILECGRDCDQPVALQPDLASVGIRNQTNVRSQQRRHHLLQPVATRTIDWPIRGRRTMFPRDCRGPVISTGTGNRRFTERTDARMRRLPLSHQS